MKNDVEICKKVFTNEGRNIIINSKYNLFNKDNKNLYERGGLFMKETNDVILSKIKNESNVDKIVLNCYYNICKYYNVKDDTIMKILSEI